MENDLNAYIDHESDSMLMEQDSYTVADAAEVTMGDSGFVSVERLVKSVWFDNR